MIRSLKIRNFQSHKKTKIKFHPELNVIVGKSDQGKSSIIRAINWVVNNKPSGDSFRSHWGGTTSVILKTNKHTVKRIKNHSNTYYLDSNKFKAFGSRVPKEIQNALKISDINIQKQITLPFLFSLSSGEVSRYINKIVNIDIIDRSIKNINSILNKEKSDYKNQKEILSQYKKEAKQYYWVHDAEKELIVLEKLHKQIRTKQKHVKKVSILLKNIDKINKKINKIKPVIDAHNSSLFKRIVKLSERIENNQRVLIDVSDLIATIKATQRKINSLNHNLDRNEQILKKILKICPLCGRGE